MGNQLLDRMHERRWKAAREVAEHGPATGKSLRCMREALQLTGRGLAAILDVSPERLSRWEHEAAPLHGGSIDVWAFALVGSMVLDAIEGRTTTRGRLAILRGSPDDSAMHNVRRAIVETVRTFVEERRRQAMDRKGSREFVREIEARARRGELNSETRGLSPMTLAILADEEYLDAQESGAAELEQRQKKARAEKREQAVEELKALLTGIDSRFAVASKAIEKALSTEPTNTSETAPAVAARLSWEAGIEEEKKRGGKWRDMRATIEGRYRNAAT